VNMGIGLKKLKNIGGSNSQIQELEKKLIDYRGQVEAISRSQAVAEFNMDGTIITANENFLNIVGYSLQELQGQHHSIFVDNEYANSAKYAKFWEELNNGLHLDKQYKRIAKGGKEIWIQASYDPIFGADGKPFKIVKYCSDVTQWKLEDAEAYARAEAINNTQAVVEFNIDGTVVNANENFLNALGYSLSEIKGKHHSMFVEADYANSEEDKEFWSQLSAGHHHAGEFMRVAKDGSNVWIQASYNPIMDLNGKPYKVVKFAMDVTEQKQMQQTVESMLGEVSTVMHGLVEGKVDHRVGGQYSGQFDRLKQAVNGYCDKISDIVVKIRESSQLVNSGAEEISRGNLDLSRRTESQAASLEQTSASMEEMTSTVKQNADNAKEANNLAIGARDQAATGGEVVGKAIAAMHEINQASNKISDIISVIDEIAFQTNLLALNAAVEAARAGEQGRGFAVVATEVRNLAGRSATAAKEIKELIEDSVQKVTDGSHLVNQSGETLEQIMDSVRQVAQIVGDISSASQEQAQGIEQVNKAIIEMDTSTQENTSLVEEAAAAAESMSEQSNELNSLVGFFQIGDQSSGSSGLAPGGVERRSSRRPWSAQESVQDVSMAVGSDVDSDGWEEF